jgi:FMN-dependent NADH-azoreductase
MLQRTVSSAVGRAIETAREAVRSDNLIEIDLASRHLSTKATEMEKLATSAGGETSDQDKERLREAEKSLKKLEARRQELTGDPDVGSSRSSPRTPSPLH